MATALTIPQRVTNSWFQNNSLNLFSGEPKNSTVFSNSAPAVKPRIVAPTVKQFVAYMISAVPEVESVLTMCEDRLLRVYTVVNAFDAAIREKVYEREERIIDEYEMFEFEFNIISRSGKPLNECITDSGLELTFQRR